MSTITRTHVILLFLIAVVIVAVVVVMIIVIITFPVMVTYCDSGIGEDNDVPEMFHSRLDAQPWCEANFRDICSVRPELCVSAFAILTLLASWLH